MSAYRCTATGCPLRGVRTEQPHEHVRNRDGSIGYRLPDPRRMPPPPPSLPEFTTAPIMSRRAVDDDDRPGPVWPFVLAGALASALVCGAVELIARLP